MRSQKRLEQIEELHLSELDKYIHRLLHGVRQRALKNGLSFNITYLDVETPTHCPCLGVELVYGSNKWGDPDSASIDRIDNSKGYIRGNVWVISRRANMIKNDASAGEIMKVGLALQRKQRESIYKITDILVEGEGPMGDYGDV